MELLVDLCDEQLAERLACTKTSFMTPLEFSRIARARVLGPWAAGERIMSRDCNETAVSPVTSPC
jgi:hypothetical protein